MSKDNKLPEQKKKTPDPIIMERTRRRLRREKEIERANCLGGPLTKPLTVESGQAQMSFQPNEYPDADEDLNEDGTRKIRGRRTIRG